MSQLAGLRWHCLAGLKTFNTMVAGLLTEGAVTAETLLDSVPRILSVVRESNVALRWLLLHMAPLDPAVAQVVQIIMYCSLPRLLIILPMNIPMSRFMPMSYS